MASVATAASIDEIAYSDEKVCDDLYNAALHGKLDEVTRLLPLAEEKGVVNKVMHGVNTHREEGERERERHELQCLSQCHVHLMSCVCESDSKTEILHCTVDSCWPWPRQGCFTPVGQGRLS